MNQEPITFLMHGVRYDKRGFTLIELLVVMAIIAIFLGVLGVALSRGNPTVSVQGGQRTLAGLVTGARAQSILKQASVRLIVHNDPPLPSDPPAVYQEKRERYLRYIGIVVLMTDPNTGNQYWDPVSEGVFLPRGVYFVPPRQYYLPNGNLEDPPPEVISNDPSKWEYARRSVLARVSDPLGVGPDRETDDYVFNSVHPAQNYFHLEFNGRGMIRGAFASEGRLVVAPAQETRTTPQFEENGDGFVLGGVLRTYGSLTMVHDPVAFPQLNQD